MAKRWIGSLTLQKRDHTLRITVDNIILEGNSEYEIKRNLRNITTALRYTERNIVKDNPSRWVVRDFILYKQLP